jgi:Bacterial Ig-like domain (group 1)
MLQRSMLPVSPSAGLAILLTLGLSTGLTREVRADCPPGWRVVPSPIGSRAFDQLNDVAITGASEAWAVGGSEDAEGSSTLIERWNGTQWSVVPSPNGSLPFNFLSSLSVVSATDVWAVGSSYNLSFADPQSRTLTLHWNGTAWSVVPTPNPTLENYLHGVVAISAGDVWAVGTSVDPSQYHSLTMHWNGSSWSIVPSPNPTFSGNILYGVDATSATDVWAVGSQHDGLEQTLVVHWNGAAWQVVPSPQIGNFNNNMLRIDAVSPSDIWAAGYHQIVVGFDEPYQTSTFHYDGNSWKAVPSPNVNQRNNYLRDIVGLAANDAWAVGFFDTGNAFKTMIQHWNGTGWTIVDSPNAPDGMGQLWGVVAAATNDVWTVGNSSGTLVERYGTVCTRTMHVSAIAPTFKRISSNRIQVRADVTVVDAAGAVVAGASVKVTVTRPDGTEQFFTGTTDVIGRARVTLNSNQAGTYTFTVTDVTGGGAIYDPAANVETSDSVVAQ